MRRVTVAAAVAVCLALVSVIPAFAHCHSRRDYSNHEVVCEASCEDGISCGVDGHYCSDHREEENCNGYVECEPVRRNHHHSHTRH